MKKIMIIGFYELKDYFLEIKESFEKYNYIVDAYPLFRYAYDAHDKIKNYAEHMDQHIKISAPDIILWWFLDVPLDIFKHIKRNNPDIFYIMYNCDEAYNMSSELLKKSQIFNLIITTTKENIMKYRVHGKVDNIIYNVFGVDNEYFKPIAEDECEEDDEKYCCDISFLCDNLCMDKNYYNCQYINRMEMIDNIILYAEKNNRIFKLFGPPVLMEYYSKYYYGEVPYIKLNKVYNKSKININDSEKWVNLVKELYFDERKYMDASKFVTEEYKKYSEEKEISMFNNVMLEVFKKSKEFNVMIFSPWCDQGLGIQSKNYYNILKDSGFNTAVFAVKPYNANTCLDLQKNKDEWLIDDVYYSGNDREHVTDVELMDFVKKYNIGKCIIPETCWYRIFQIALLMRNNYVQCYAIPNIEIVRKDEVFKHQYFHKILCNNHLCENIFHKYGIKTTKYVGYGLLHTENVFKSLKIANGEKFKFLFIGGMNAFSRKHILSICEAFVNACVVAKNILLTCTIQHTNLLEVDDAEKIGKYSEHPNITIIQEHLSNKKITELYHNHHISIQVSKHEGLGLGFYDAIYTGTPVITLNTPPHNEVITNNVNGWTIPCYYKKMTDNKDPLFDSAYFDPEVLKKKILDIVANVDQYNNIVRKLTGDLGSRLSYATFRRNFIDGIWS